MAVAVVGEAVVGGRKLAFWWGVFQFLGAGSHVPICQRVDGEERENAHHHLCLGRAGFHYSLFALDIYQSPK